jgi:acyl dehydratase
MALNRALLGKAYANPQTYVVSRHAIGDFARAINDDDPRYLDPEAARAAGYADVVAPPTFLVAVGARAQDGGPLHDPELGLDYSLVVHTEQKFALHRPVVAGDELTLVARISQMKDIGPNELLGIDTEVHDAAGAHVATVFMSVLSRGTAAPKEAS